MDITTLETEIDRQDSEQERADAAGDFIIYDTPTTMVCIPYFSQTEDTSNGTLNFQSIFSGLRRKMT